MAQLARPRAPKALRSFMGGSDRKNPLERPQDVFTRPELLAPLLRVWGGIALDPCAARRSPIRAQRYVYARRVRDETRRGWHWKGRGLLVPWADRTYVNSPYENLALWVRKAQLEGASNRVCMLCPVRTQRAWLRPAMRSAGVFALNPVSFFGYSEQFPAPLMLLYWGHDVRKVFAAYERAELGETLWYRWSVLR